MRPEIRDQKTKNERQKKEVRRQRILKSECGKWNRETEDRGTENRSRNAELWDCGRFTEKDEL